MLLYSLESPRQGDSNEYQQHMFLWRTDKNYPSIISKNLPYLFFWLNLQIWENVEDLLIFMNELLA